MKRYNTFINQGNIQEIGGNTMSNEKVEKILDRVKKILALAGNNPSEEEAKAAALKAQELLAKYNLSMADIGDENAPKEKLMFKHYQTGVDKAWKYDLSAVVARNFRCRVTWFGKRELAFYGFETDANIACEVFEFLFKTCEKRSRYTADKAYRETGCSKGVYYSFSKGFISGVASELDKQCTALMIVEAPEVKEGYTAWRESRNVKTMSIHRRDAKDFDKNHYNNGVVEGRNAIQARGIESQR